MQMKGWILPAIALIIFVTLPNVFKPVEAQRAYSAGGAGVTRGASSAERLQILEDREEIRQLLINYGRTLDQKDFAGFARLFARNAEYHGGGGAAITRGPGAIARLLEDVIEKNPSQLNAPSFHLFCNETIQVAGNGATAISKGIFVARGDGNQPEAVMLATYRDVLVREDGAWKFRQRLVQGDIP